MERKCVKVLTDLLKLLKQQITIRQQEKKYTLLEDYYQIQNKNTLK